MKKLMMVFCFLLLMLPVSANDKIEAVLSKCVDGDTAYFQVNGADVKARFLAVDTPESTNRIDPYGREASAFTCSALRSAKKIELAYDDQSDTKDKYGRALVWVFVDDVLLQDTLVKEGYAKIAYVYGDYAYIDQLKKSEKAAKQNRLHIWSMEETERKLDSQEFVILFLGAAAILILSITKVKGRKKHIKVIKKAMKKIVKS